MSFIEAVVNIGMTASMAQTNEPPTIKIEFRTPADLARFKARVYDEAAMLRQTILTDNSDEMIIGGVHVEFIVKPQVPKCECGGACQRCAGKCKCKTCCHLGRAP